MLPKTAMSRRKYSGLKTRAKWRESPVELKHSGAIVKNELSDLPDQDLLDLIYTLGREVGHDRSQLDVR
jgi:hypothetical protein